MQRKLRGAKRLLGIVMSLALVLEASSIQVLAEERAGMGEQVVYGTVGEENADAPEDEAGTEEDGEEHPGETESAGQDAAMSGDETETENENETDSQDMDDAEYAGETDVYAGEEPERLRVLSVSDGDAAEVVASGTYYGMDWTIDADGFLTISGEYDENDVGTGTWNDNYATSITSAKVVATGVKSTKEWFSGCWGLENVDLSEFDTSNVRDMSSMFKGCSNLTELDVSGFNTGNVTNMSNMFRDCMYLKGLDVSSFDTSLVTDMSGMFCNCGFVTKLEDGALGVEYGKIIGISSFDTSNVMDMSCMFQSCGVASLDLSGFDTSRVTDMSGMFLASFIYPDDEHAENGSKVDLDTSNVTDMSYMFYQAIGTNGIIVSSFDTGKVTDMSYMFYGVKWQDSIDVSSFDTSNVTDMKYMFANCSGLKSLDMSRFNTSQVTDMSSMFWSCGSLEYLDLSAFDDGKLQNASDMLKGCNKLQWIKTPKSLAVQVELPFRMTDSTKKSYHDLPQGLTESIQLGIPTSGTYYGMDWEINDNGFMTISGEYNEEAMGDDWKSCAKNATSIEVTVKNVKSTKDWFSGFTVLESIDFNEFETGKVTDMSGMFAGCGLTNLDVSGFDTSQVTDMRNMFSKCWLSSLDLSGFDTSHVTDMSGMFAGCHGLTNLDVSGFDTSQVTDMSDMFSGCWRLSSLDVSGFDTGRVTDMSSMFASCGDLSSLDVSGFDTGRVTDMSSMFEYCDDLSSLDVHNFDTSQVTNMTSMFASGSSLSSLDVSSFDMRQVTNMYFMFENCSSLKKLDLSSFELEAMPVTHYGDSILDGCAMLMWLKVPKNMYAFIPLPFTMYDSEKNPYTEFPRNLSEPMELWKNADQSMDPDTPDNPDNPDIPDDPTGEKVFRITPIPGQTYTGKAIKPDVTVTYGQKTLQQGVDYTVSYKNTVNAAAAADSDAPTVIVKGKGNYSESMAERFTILAKSLTEENTQIAAMVYTADGKEKKTVPAVTVDGIKLKAGRDYDAEFPDTVSGAYKEPGRYTVRITGKGNYQGSVTATAVILSKTQVAASKLKVGKIPTCTYAEGVPAAPVPAKVTYGGRELECGKDYAITYRNNDRAGKAVLIITGLENTGEDGVYVYGSVEKTFTVKGTPLGKAKVEYTNQTIYTGSEICPAVELTLNGTALRSGKDYTVSYSNNLNAGKGTIILTGCGGYTGTVKKTFTIKPSEIETERLQVNFTSGLASVSYDPSGAKPEINLQITGGTVLKSGRDYTVSYKNNKKIAAADGAKAPALIIKGKGNYKFQKTVNFAIVSKSLADTDITATASDKICSAKGDKRSLPVVKDGNGRKLKAGRDYRIVGYYLNSTGNQTDVGAGTETEFTGQGEIAPGTVVTVKIQGQGSYTGETATSYRIAAKDISKTTVNVPKLEYNGAAVVLTDKMLQDGILKVTDKTAKQDLVYGTDYIITGYKNNTKKGTATVTLQGIGTYGGTRTVKFIIVVKKMKK